MIVETFIPEVKQIVDSADERELWIVGREFERPPYFHAGKGGDTRLARALRVCIENRIAPHSDGTYLVEGSEHRTYRVGDSCSCPQSQNAKSKYCYHFVAVCLYVEWQRRIRNAAPVALGTLRAGTLPLPPATVDARLAQAPPAVDLPLIAPREEGPVYETSDGTRYTLPEGEIMADEYLSEPATDHVSTAVVEPPDTTAATPRPLPGPVLLPSLDAQTLKRSMQEWSAQRQVIKSFLQQELKEGVDFYRLQVRGKDANPTLSKAGAEKFLGLFQLQASFAPDLLTWEMLGKPTDHVIYICTLRTRSGEIVGEGRGSRSLKKDSGDTNKAIKMSEKSALIDAVLRTGALSEVYTQDVEDLQEESTPDPAASTKPTPQSQDLRKRIWAQVKRQAPHVKTQDDAEAWVKERTGLAMEPDHYQSILTALEARA